MNEKEYVSNRLRSFKEEDVIITNHALIRLLQRQMTVEEVIENIINPERLEYAIRESINDGEKFDCYFMYSNTSCHRYVLVIKNNVVVVTVIKINRRWQRIVNKKLK